MYNIIHTTYNWNGLLQLLFLAKILLLGIEKYKLSRKKSAVWNPIFILFWIYYKITYSDIIIKKKFRLYVFSVYQIVKIL